MKYRYLFLGIILFAVQLQAQNVVEVAADSAQTAVLSQQEEVADTADAQAGLTKQDSLYNARRSPISQSALAKKTLEDGTVAEESDSRFKEWMQTLTQSDTSWLYLLERPRVSKRFKEKKKFGDHLFLEIGGGVNTVFTRRTPSRMDKMGAIGNIAIGDWITPEHGVRLGFSAAEHRIYKINSRAISFSADYMMNFSAVGSRTYEKPNPIEYYGIVGMEVNYSNSRSGIVAPSLQKHLAGWGLRFGLRAQFRLSDYTYAYVEPRLGFYSDNLIHAETYRGIRPIGSLLAGVGYRLQPVDYRKRYDYDSDGSFFNDMFFSVWGGPHWLISGIENFNDKLGGRFGVSAGKWFNHLHGAKINVQASKGRNPNGFHYYRKFKTLTVGADYMFNLHNAFAGYNPDRRYWVNALAGLSMNYSSGVHGHKPSFGFGGGLQANVRLGGGVDFFLEPRVDVYSGGYVTNFTTTKSNDATASLLAGFAFRQGLDSKTKRQRNDDFENKTWYDNLEFQAGMGAVIPAHSYAFDRISKFFSPKAFVSVGKWFTPIVGVRLWGEAGVVKSQFVNREKKRAVTFGVDYMWNATNTFHGYDPERPLEVVTTLGVNRSQQPAGRTFYGANASIKGLWKMNKIWGLFLEPQAHLYKKDYIIGSTPGLAGDLILSAVAGVQINANGYRPRIDSGTYHDEGNRSFISLGLGTAANGDELRWGKQYGFAGRMSFGHWFHPVAAWRANLEAYYKVIGINGPRYAKGMLGADLLLDVNAIAFGFDSERLFSTRVLGGLNLGVEHISGGAESGFIPDVHAGLQFAFRVSPTVELYAEPVLSYQFKQPLGRIGNLTKFQPKAFAGINYRFGGADGTSYKNVEKREKKQFVSAAIGTGLNTLNFGYYDGKKMTFTADVTYGRWLTNVSAIRAGLSHTSVPFEPLAGRQLSSIHVDYMADLTAIATGESSEEKLFRLYGFAGLSAASCKHKEHDERKWGFGGQVGVQLAFRVAPAFEVFAEPVVHVMSKSVMPDYSRHPAEADLKLLVGTKFSF